jgi:hypothetical protein
MNKWNKYNSWLDVQNAINSLLSATTSSNRGVQQKAITQFYGIELEDQSQAVFGNVPNVEIFWFTPDNDIRNVNTTFNTTFLGRRIRSQIPIITGSTGLRGAQSTQGSFVFITNIVVPSATKFYMKCTSDSGFLVSTNPIATQYSGSGKDVANQEFSAILPSYSPMNQITTTSPWTVGQGLDGGGGGPTCTAQNPDGEGFDRHGSDIGPGMAVEGGPDGCANRCCGNPECVAWTYLATIQHGDQNCPTGGSCCWIKNTAPPAKPYSYPGGIWSGTVPKPQPPAPASPPGARNAVTNIIHGYYLGNGNTFKLEYKIESGIPSVCGCYGSPSADGKIRSYTEDECKNGLNGNWFSDGQCLIGHGRDGSYSAMCSGLNAQTPCANSWSQFPGSMLYLTQDPFAPMLSFEVRQNYSSYGCDFAFCDKRLGSHKMKWQNHGWGGPQINFVGTSKDTSQYVLGKSYMTFANQCAINSMFLMKLYSFVTLTAIIRFQTVPAEGVSESPIVFWGTSGFYPSIRINGIGGGEATVNVGMPDFMKSANPPPPAGTPMPSSDGPTITEGSTYMITLNMIRTNPSDIYSLNAISVGAALLSDLQNDPSNIQTSTPITYSPSSNLENPDSSASSFMWVRVSNTMTYDLFAIQLYDYPLTGTYLQNAALDNWAQLPGLK